MPIFVEEQLDLQRMWLSHHHDHQLERCLLIGGRHVCRRCFVMYPIAFAVLTLSLLGHALPTWTMFVLPIPVTAEFLAEHAGVRYCARRQVLTTVFAAPALGAGFGRVMHNVVDGPFWAMISVFAVPCLLVVVFQVWREQRVGGDLRDADHPLLRGFGSAAEFQQYLEAAGAQTGD